MSKDKMTAPPWIAGGSFPYKGNEGYIFGVTTRPEVLVCKTFGSIDENCPPIREQMENSKAIVSAVNATYGNGINPEAVKEMYEALLEIDSIWGQEWGWNKHPPFLKAKSAIEKAKL